MKIRTKSIIIFLILSLGPLAIIGAIAYKNGENIIKRSLGSSFQLIANETTERVDSTLYEVYNDIQTWSELELMQEVITDDLDGKISSFLMGLSKEYGYFSSIDALNSSGEVVASSNLEFIGRDFAENDYYKNTIGGKTYIEDVHLDKINEEWVVTFSLPIKAKFDEDKIIGVLCAKWKADELFNIVSAFMKGEERYYDHIMLLRSDGLVIFAPEPEKEDIFKSNLIKTGLKSALLASQKEQGYLIEIDEHNRKSLIGYSYSKGYRDFSGPGWLVLVIEETKIAFARIEQLKTIIFGIGAIVALLITIISIVVTRKMTSPILEISRIATRVAQGDFEGRVDYTSRDEIGFLAKTFNQMTQDLKDQRAQLVDKDYVDSIIANMIDTLIVVDPEGIIKTVNQAIERLLGYEAKELIGKPVDVLFTGQEDGLIFKGNSREVLVKEGSIHNYDMSYRTKNGDIIPVSFSGAVMKNKKGEVVGIVGIARDMREIKRLETQLIRSEKLAAIGELAAGVAHEINNPLNVISGNAEMLSKESHDQEVKRVTKVIMEQVKRTAFITDRLLQFSRRKDPKIESLDVNKIIDNTLPLLEIQTKYKNIKIIKQLRPNLPKVIGDIIQLQEVFFNIMLNAVQAMPKGGELRIRASVEEIAKFGRRKTDIFQIGSKLVVIEFEDTGEGISEENLSKIFDPFFSTKDQGTGLGLSICHGIIEAHQGVIEAMSTAGKGTTFIIKLPAQREKGIHNG